MEKLFLAKANLIAIIIIITKNNKNNIAIEYLL